MGEQSRIGKNRAPWPPCALLLLLLLGGGRLPAALGADDVFKGLSLEDLMHMKLTVASKTAVSPREAPGIVTVITREEILASGARDLIDVLRLVPGYEFGIDVRGVTSLGIRGLWAHEGKVLVLWDGQIMNELLFPSIQLGNHYPVDLIERVEIIRGPGSAIYGGDAELGVINVISRPASELEGVMAGTTLGWMEESNSLRNVFAGFGHKTGDFRLDASIFGGYADRSGELFSDYYPANPSHTFDMTGQETLHPLFVNLGLQWKDLKSRLIIDRYHLHDRTMYGVNLPTAVRVDFLSIIADLTYDLRVNSKLRITPRFNYIQNTPWQCLDPRYPPPVYLDKWADRYTVSVTADCQATRQINVLSGFEYYKDIGHAGPKTFFLHSPTCKELSYNNLAVFAQGMWLNDVVNLTVGARFEHNSEAGNSFVPRIVATKVIDKFHFKALYSHAFRSPGIENISRYASVPIRPEKLVALEFEAGYLLTPTMMLSANVFSMRIKDPIVFFIDPVLRAPAYHNATKTGSRGIEAQYRLKTDRVSVTASYSYYQACDNEVPDYVVREDSSLLLGFPHHKVTVGGSVRLRPSLTLQATFNYLSRRYTDVNVAQTQPTQDPVFLLDAFLSYEPRQWKGLIVQVGVHDLLNTHYAFIQPYNGGSAPLPGPTREFQIKALFNFNFK